MNTPGAMYIPWAPAPLTWAGVRSLFQAVFSTNARKEARPRPTGTFGSRPVRSRLRQPSKFYSPIIFPFNPLRKFFYGHRTIPRRKRGVRRCRQSLGKTGISQGFLPPLGFFCSQEIFRQKIFFEDGIFLNKVFLQPTPPPKKKTIRQANNSAELGKKRRTVHWSQR